MTMNTLIKAILGICATACICGIIFILTKEVEVKNNSVDIRENYSTDKLQTADQVSKMELAEIDNLKEYRACGCDCCEDKTPQKVCLDKDKGGRLRDVVIQDRKTKNSPSCSKVGCAVGFLYTYCD